VPSLIRFRLPCVVVICHKSGKEKESFLLFCFILGGKSINPGGLKAVLPFDGERINAFLLIPFSLESTYCYKEYVNKTIKFKLFNSYN